MKEHGCGCGQETISSYLAGPAHAQLERLLFELTGAEGHSRREQHVAMLERLVEMVRFMER